jgi:ribosome-associated protein
MTTSVSPTTAADRAKQSRDFAIATARHAAATRCHSVVVLDVAGISPVCDYFVIATGTSARQMRTVLDEITEQIAPRHNMSSLSVSGEDSGTWVLADFFDVLVHIFSAEARSFYDLDGLWGDARSVDWTAENV